MYRCIYVIILFERKTFYFVELVYEELIIKNVQSFYAVKRMVEIYRFETIRQYFEGLWFVVCLLSYPS